MNLEHAAYLWAHPDGSVTNPADRPAVLVTNDDATTEEFVPTGQPSACLFHSIGALDGGYVEVASGPHKHRLIRPDDLDSGADDA